MNFDFHWRAQSSIYRDSVDLLAARHVGNQLDVVQPAEYVVKRQEHHDLVVEPTLELSHDSARSLMQALWDAGIRPNNGEGSGAEVAALKGHIKFAETVAVALLPRAQT